MCFCFVGVNGFGYVLMIVKMLLMIKYSLFMVILCGVFVGDCFYVF